MFTQDTVSILARITPSSIGQLQLLESSNMDITIRVKLASNPALCPALWERLWETREVGQHHHSAITYPLIINAKTKEQIARVISESTAETLADALLGSDTTPDPALAKAICEKITNGASTDVNELAAAVQSGFLDPSLLTSYLEVIEDYSKNGDNTLLLAMILEAAITKYEVLTDEQALTFLEAYPEESYTIARVLDARPRLIKLATKSRYAEDFYQEIAASRHLFEPEATQLFRELEAQELDLPGKSLLLITLNHLIANANVSYQTRVAAKALLLQALEDGGDDSVLFPWEDEAPAKLGASMKLDASASSNLTPWQTTQGASLELVKHSITYLGYWRYPTLAELPQFSEFKTLPGHQNNNVELSDSYIATELSSYLDSLGPTAWKLFIHLLPDWDQGTKALLAVVKSNLT